MRWKAEVWWSERHVAADGRPRRSEPSRYCFYESAWARRAIAKATRHPQGGSTARSLVVVTLVLTCLLPDHIIQVADSRLTRALPTRIDVVDEHSWKATVVGSRIVIGYSGLANFAVDGSEPADLWLLEQDALRLPTVSECASALAGAIASRFAALSPRIPEAARRQAFILAGWDDVSGPPRAAVVSNALGRDDRWAPIPRPDFEVQHYGLERRDFLLRAVGARMDGVYRVVEDHVQAALSSANPLQRIVMTLCRGVRDVAATTETVGEELLVTVLPRASADATGTGLVITDRIQQALPSFLFLPASSSGSLVGRYPNYVGAHAMIARAQAHNRAFTPEEVRQRYLSQKHQFERRKPGGR